MQIVFYVTHMAACGFYFIALQMGFGPNTWIGAHFGPHVEDIPIFTRCLHDVAYLHAHSRFGVAPNQTKTASVIDRAVSSGSM